MLCFQLLLTAQSILSLRNRKRGLIVTVGSFSGGTIASPMLATYSGSKAFLASFITAIAEEVKGKGVDVECLNTYFVVCAKHLYKLLTKYILTSTRSLKYRKYAMRVPWFLLQKISYALPLAKFVPKHSKTQTRFIDQIFLIRLGLRVARSVPVVPISVPRTGVMLCSIGLL